MKISARIGGRVTSFGIRDSLCCLHYLITCQNERATVLSHIQDTVAGRILPKWDSDNARGLSGYVSDFLITDLLPKEDLTDYLQILKDLPHE